jgi:hypothetical protein
MNLNFFKVAMPCRSSLNFGGGVKYFTVCLSMILLQCFGVLCFGFRYFSVGSPGRLRKRLTTRNA